MEVAKKAGVGAATVSRAINGGNRVDPATLARIQLAIHTLGYMPSQAARILKGDKTRTVGFVVPSIADPFFAACADAAQAVARAHDSMLMLLTTQDDPKIEMEAVQMLVRHRVDGFIVAPAISDNETVPAFFRYVRTPMVALDRPVKHQEISSVFADNFAGARMAVDHLISHGYRNIVCLAGETGLYTIRERIRGYKEAVEAAGLKANIEFSVTDSTAAQQTLRQLLAGPRRPDAIFTLKNSVTIATVEALQAMRIAVPETVALLGYDDFQLAATLHPAISVVHQPIEEMGKIAAELLFERLLESADPAAALSPAVQMKLKTRLVLRESCGCAGKASAGDRM